MKLTFDEVLDAARQLSMDQQIDLVDLISVNLPFDEDEWKRKWSEECHRRVAEAEADPSLWLTMEAFQRRTNEFVASLRAKRA